MVCSLVMVDLTINIQNPRRKQVHMEHLVILQAVILMVHNLHMVDLLAATNMQSPRRRRISMVHQATHQAVTLMVHN
jgi:hypothetical protein